MPYNVKLHPNLTVVELPDQQIDATYLFALISFLQPVLVAGSSLLLDLRCVTTIHSCLLKGLLQLETDLKDDGIRLQICESRPRMRLLLRGLRANLEVFRKPEEVLEGLPRAS